jgi:hypothetical protein
LTRKPIHYLSDFEVPVPAAEFEREIDGVIDLVLRRLDGPSKTELHVLWRELMDERADPEQSVARRLEARLGYDPDGAPVQLLERMLALGDILRFASLPRVQGRISFDLANRQ